jgi:flagellar operon protein (TIGR03826 family)
MEVKSCKGCGRLFNYVSGQPLCQSCLKKLEEKFQEVKQYLYDNPNASVNEVSEANDVTVKQIKQWIREERLMFSSATAAGVVCEHCGTPICSGRFCDKCKAELSNTFSGAITKTSAPQEEKKERNGNRMRFLQ